MGQGSRNEPERERERETKTITIKNEITVTLLEITNRFTTSKTTPQRQIRFVVITGLSELGQLMTHVTLGKMAGR